MTNFLPAGIIKDTITDIYQKTNELKNERNVILLKRGLEEIEDLALDLAIFLEKLSCDPLIFTGSGSTEEVIKRLDIALSFIDKIDPVELFQYNLEMNKRNSK
jgi:hypothetical protein